jgi:hypothetical protein
MIKLAKHRYSMCYEPFQFRSIYSYVRLCFHGEIGIESIKRDLLEQSLVLHKIYNDLNAQVAFS